MARESTERTGERSGRSAEQPLDPQPGDATDATAQELERALAASRAPSTAPQGAAAEDLLARLDSLRPQQASAAVTRAVVRTLDSIKTEPARGSPQAALRSAAVAALLRLGYPWALQVRPEDLAFYRANSRPRSSKWRWLAAALAVAAAAAGAGVWWSAGAAAEVGAWWSAGAYRTIDPRFVPGPPPVVISRVEAVPPVGAGLAPVQEVQLMVAIDERGVPLWVEIKRPAGFGLDEAAQIAVRQFRFQPLERNGHPVSGSFEYVYRFPPQAP